MVGVHSMCLRRVDANATVGYTSDSDHQKIAVAVLGQVIGGARAKSSDCILLFVMQTEDQNWELWPIGFNQFDQIQPVAPWHRKLKDQHIPILVANFCITSKPLAASPATMKSSVSARICFRLLRMTTWSSASKTFSLSMIFHSRAYRRATASCKIYKQQPTANINFRIWSEQQRNCGIQSPSAG